jgi:hypothetical protein
LGIGEFESESEPSRDFNDALLLILLKGFSLYEFDIGAIGGGGLGKFSIRSVCGLRPAEARS